MIEHDPGHRTSRISRSHILALPLVLVAWLVLADDALACENEPVTHHCYSVVQWYMAASGEEVLGAKAELETFYAEVPRWQSGDFITNELWVVFPQWSDAWVEGGTITGADRSESSPHYFEARSYGPKELEVFINEGPGPADGAVYGLYIDEPYGRNGEWCETWAWDKGPNLCFSGFPHSSTFLQTGMEYATPTSSGATNFGTSIGWAYWTNDTWHEDWAGSGAHATGYTTSSCFGIDDPIPGYNWGSIEFWAPETGCGDADVAGSASSPPVRPPSPGQAPEPEYTAPTGPLLSDGRIREIADEFASQSGDSSPASIHAVNTSQRGAIEANPNNQIRATDPADVARYDGEVVLVTVEGSFTLAGAPVPPGASAPTGKVLTLAINAHTGWIDYYGISEAPASGVSALGTSRSLG
ncbi:MAG TPA: hypothetical protein VK701_04140 [Solirubrobacteraceae bacterium]|jgi:hypothetical protein|nr:hypothetical protein [Solirubrobacteraceae bacterium]